MKSIYVKHHNGFASIFTLIILMLVISYTSVLMNQIYTYAQLSESYLIDLYVLRSIKVAHSNPNTSYPIEDDYDGTYIRIEKEETYYYAYYLQNHIKVYFEENGRMVYEYLN